MKNSIRSAGAQHQLVTPDIHRSLINDQEIQTFKHLLISGLSSCDPKSPLNLWCRLIRQEVLTLNFFCPEELNPRLSAESLLNGAFDFNQTPLAPPRTKVLIFERPGERLSFAQHGV